MEGPESRAPERAGAARATFARGSPEGAACRPARQAQGWADKKGIWGSRGRPPGGAKAAGSRPLLHDPPCPAPPALGQSARRGPVSFRALWAAAPGMVRASQPRRGGGLLRLPGPAPALRDPEVKAVKGKGPGALLALEKWSRCALPAALRRPSPRGRSLPPPRAGVGPLPSLKARSLRAGVCTAPSTPAEAGPEDTASPGAPGPLVQGARSRVWGGTLHGPTEGREWGPLGQTLRTALHWPHPPPHLPTFSDSWSP